jgi:hypothetical protein
LTMPGTKHACVTPYGYKTASDTAQQLHCSLLHCKPPTLTSKVDSADGMPLTPSDALVLRNVPPDTSAEVLPVMPVMPDIPDMPWALAVLPGILDMPDMPDMPVPVLMSLTGAPASCRPACSAIMP